MFSKKIQYISIALCMLLTALLCGCGSDSNDLPNTGFVQMGNPLVTVNSVQEMEQQLGYSVPLLDKEVSAYIVLVINGSADSGRILYADGSDFNIKQGTGDISGIYGGVPEHTEIIGSTVENGHIIGGTLVSFYVFEDIRYAIWEKDGFTFSLTGAETLENDVAALLAK